MVKRSWVQISSILQLEETYFIQISMKLQITLHSTDKIPFSLYKFSIYATTIDVIFLNLVKNIMRFVRKLLPVPDTIYFTLNTIRNFVSEKCLKGSSA